MHETVFHAADCRFVFPALDAVKEQDFMAAMHEFAYKLMLAVVAVLMVSAQCTRADSDELPLLPNSADTVCTRFNPAQQLSTTNDCESTADSNPLKSLHDVPSMNGWTNQDDQFRLGDSFLGVQTEKNLQVIDRSRRNDDCTAYDECEDYSGLPKSGPPKRTLRNLKKPFIGLSITRPLRW
jgi:hypothetical protein